MAASDLALVGCDTGHIVRVLRHEVSIEVHQSFAYFGGVLLIDTEDNGLGEPTSFFQKVRQVPRNCVRARTQGYDALEVPRLVLVVWDGATVSVEFISARTPAGGVPLRDHAVNAV